MSNGDDYLYQELDGEIKKREEAKYDFGKCNVGEDFAKSIHHGTTMLLKCERNRARREIDKQKSGVVIGGVKFTGWAAIAVVAVIAVGKAHGWW